MINKDYTTYTNEELVTMIRSGEEDAYAQLFINLKPVTLHESKMYSHKMVTYGIDDFLQEGRILMWEIVRKDNFKGGNFRVYYGRAIRRRFARIWRDYNLKNLMCIEENEDVYGNIYQILVESDYAKRARVKRSEEQRRYYLKKKAQQPPKEKKTQKPPKPKHTKEEKARRVREYQKRYYAEHPEKLEERRAKARLYEKRKRERLKAERLAAKAALQTQSE